MKKAKRFEAWRFHLQPNYFKEVWRKMELDKPGICAPGEIEVLPGEGHEHVYHVRHHYRQTAGY